MAKAKKVVETIKVIAAPDFHNRRFFSLPEGVMTVEQFRELKAGSPLEIDREKFNQNSTLFIEVK